MNPLPGRRLASMTHVSRTKYWTTLHSYAQAFATMFFITAASLPFRCCGAAVDTTEKHRAMRCWRHEYHWSSCVIPAVVEMTALNATGHRRADMNSEHLIFLRSHSPRKTTPHASRRLTFRNHRCPHRQRKDRKPKALQRPRPTLPFAPAV